MELLEHRALERQRIAFVVSRDGVDGARQFARQTLRIYRAGVLNKRSFMSKSDWNSMFIASYLEFKAFLVRDRSRD